MRLTTRFLMPDFGGVGGTSKGCTSPMPTVEDKLSEAQGTGKCARIGRDFMTIRPQPSRLVETFKIRRTDTFAAK